MVRDLSVSTLHPRNTKTKWTPPFQRIPRWESRFWFAFMFCGILATPAWILYHLPDYRGGIGLNASYIRRQQKEESKSQE